MVAHLFWQDVKRNLRAVRVLPLLALAMYLVYKDVDHPYAGPSEDLPGALTRHHEWLYNVIPLFAGLMGASLAHERRTGITLTMLARGVSRSQYLRSKLFGAAASGALVTLIAIGALYAIATIAWLPERETLVDEFAWTRGSPYFLPVQNLVVHDIIAAWMLISAAAALCLVGVLAGLIIANEYVAMASPPIFTILLAVLTRHISRAVNPEAYLSLWYANSVPDWLVFFAPFLYWGVFSLLITALCKRIIATKELA